MVRDLISWRIAALVVIGHGSRRSHSTSIEDVELRGEVIEVVDG